MERLVRWRRDTWYWNGQRPSPSGRRLQDAHGAAAAGPAVAGVVPGAPAGDLGRRAGPPAVRVPPEPARPHRRAVLLCSARSAPALPALLRLHGGRLVDPRQGALQREPLLSLALLHLQCVLPLAHHRTPWALGAGPLHSHWCLLVCCK